MKLFNTDSGFDCKKAFTIIILLQIIVNICLLLDSVSNMIKIWEYQDLTKEVLEVKDILKSSFLNPSNYPPRTYYYDDMPCYPSPLVGCYTNDPERCYTLTNDSKGTWFYDKSNAVIRYERNKP